ncbi:sperm acrosome-associated protein 9 isoform X3 [Gorilla gorilla gorilla]|uniref:sperm acrosome-associated protein 9 isoform X3 n=1 Tax=Gorilla gorilla gorilla TaxID=9595 RepID=UPI00300A1BB2
MKWACSSGLDHSQFLRSTRSDLPLWPNLRRSHWVQSYMEHYCNSSTDRRVLLMFLDICSELTKLCQHFEAVHSGTPVTNNLLEKCKTLVSQSNDLSSLRAKYPHDVVNHLSCDEARNHYGGVVSLIPLILDLMKEWIAHSEKLPRKVLQQGETVKNKKYSTTSLPDLVSWDLSLKENLHLP